MTLSEKIANGMSILIPSYNNLGYLKQCISSLITYSVFKNQILVYLQNARTEEMEYLRKMEISFLVSDENVGIPKAVNALFGIADKDVVMYANDDMFFLPGWDYYLMEFTLKERIPSLAWISSTMIEPKGNNDCVLVRNYGDDLTKFESGRLLTDLHDIRFDARDMKGSTWPPNLMDRVYFERIGGFSEQYGIGMGTDPDLAKKMYDIGCRHFIGVGNSLVYHFGSKTTRRVKRNDGKTMFRNTHGMSIDYFVTNILERGSKYEK